MVTERKNQTFAAELPETPVMLNADPMRIQRVIANPPDNAAKFTPETGMITAKVEVLPTEIRLTVSDTGGCFLRSFSSASVFCRPADGG